MGVKMDMNWFQVLVIVFGNAAWTIPMWLWARSESRADQRAMMTMIQAIQTEMKDFHGKLERQDAEFKAYVMYNRDKKD